jgi:hypothetical protein
MTRTNSFLISAVAMVALAFAAAPAMASDGYSSVTALTGDPATERSSEPAGTVTALTGDPATERSAPSDSYSSGASLTGDPAADGIQSPSPSITAHDEGGFDWGDALIGAAVASGLLGLAFVGARSVARHRRAATEPRV